AVEPFDGLPFAMAAAAWVAVLAAIGVAAFGVGRWRGRPAPGAAGRAAPAGRLAAPHLPAFDGLRGLAVAWVISFHALALLKPPGTGLNPLLWPFAAGQLGVDLFFV